MKALEGRPLALSFEEVQRADGYSEDLLERIGDLEDQIFIWAVQAADDRIACDEVKVAVDLGTA